LLKDEQIKFGVLTGDVVPHPTPLDWDGIDNDIKLIGKTVYIAAGNHDLEDRLLFENRYGSTYYNFNFN